MQREHPFFVNIISPVKSCPLQLAGRQLYFYSLREQYRIVSNRESGRGRYDIAMYPLSENMDGFLMEFKVRNASKEKDLEETARNALLQIEEKRYDNDLLAAGIPKDRIYKLGIAFDEKDVRIRTSLYMQGYRTKCIDENHYPLLRFFPAPNATAPLNASITRYKVAGLSSPVFGLDVFFFPFCFSADAFSSCF